MPTLIACQACGTKLKAPDNLAGRKAKCPRCGGLIPIGPAPLPPTKSAPKAVAAPPKTKSAPRKPAKVEDDEEVVAAQLDETAEAAKLDAEGDEASAEEQPQKKKKKKKRRRYQADDDAPTGVPVWAWWVGAAVTLLLVAGVAVLLSMRENAPATLFMLSLKLAIMLPVSFVLLFASMFLGNLIAGGINFGELFSAIPKAIILLLVANLIELVVEQFDLGIYVESSLLFIWFLIGFIVFFHLDLWEARFVILINWVLNMGAVYLVFLLVSLILRGGGGGAKGIEDLPGKDRLPEPLQHGQPGFDVGGDNNDDN